ncbi:GNAT family N-acetyltransferase [Nocardiopsis ganjiahuensis]|uniref:GNAT family N-acetyltransferase n=1 Tax=Nocardiopsis ganjiahuensis TaxID=239984 RepID=UPI000346E166|nr:GNAT family N-acetyltransferase [Nocardiopsis ganjiahuensis]
MGQAERSERVETVPEGFAERGWTIRAGGKDDLPAVVEVVAEALLTKEEPGFWVDRLDPVLAEDHYGRQLLALETDRPGGAAESGDERLVEGGRVIGAVNAFSFRMSVPGGTRAAAGVTGVGVWPTRRRRGVLTALMRRQLADIRDRGEKLAVLWASEGAIYGRFGYAPATSAYEIGVEAAHARLRPDAPRDPGLTTELVRVFRARAALERVHAAVADREVGRVQRSRAFWDTTLRDTPDSRQGRSPLKAVVVSGPDGPQGYALYRTGNREVYVQEVLATAPAARTALYEHLFSRDLVTRLVFTPTSQDDPLRHLIADPKRLSVTFDDSLWLRLVDVPGALAERSYAAPVDVVLEVSDRHAPWNEGRWRLRADRSGATCEPTEDAPDLSLDVSHLGAVHLGGRTLTGYLRSGLITEHTPGAVGGLDTALFRPDAPFCDLAF